MSGQPHISDGFRGRSASTEGTGLLKCVYGKFTAGCEAQVLQERVIRNGKNGVCQQSKNRGCSREFVFNRKKISMGRQEIKEAGGGKAHSAA